MDADVHVSIVSHGQAPLTDGLLSDLARCAGDLRLAVTLTLNLEEDPPSPPAGLAVAVQRNARPRGFGANHNRAFAAVSAPAPYFCVINPDMRLEAEVLPTLTRTMASRPSLAVTAPLVTDADGVVQDSARRVPTPRGILARALVGGGRLDYALEGRLLQPDWVAGMFMLWRSSAFAELGGFDERYFLYYEDVDLCCRARLRGLGVGLDPAVSVVHRGARPRQRRLRHLRAHLSSMRRFFRSSVYRHALRLGGEAREAQAQREPAW